MNPINYDDAVELTAPASTNRPLSDKEMLAVRRRLAALEEELSRIMENSDDALSSPDDRDGEDSAADRCMTSIIWYRSLLSCFRSFPTEILQTIFGFVVGIEVQRIEDSFGFTATLQSRQADLAHICQVCRRWRDHARSFPELWTELPHLEFRDWAMPPQRDGPPLGAQVDIFNLYLELSGSLPISFSWACSQAIWEGTTQILEDAKDTLKTLVDNCHRWENAGLHVPSGALPFLSPIRNRIPALKQLGFRVEEDRIGFTAPWTIDYFSEAPRLERLKTRSINRTFRLPMPIVLKSLDMTWDAIGGQELYTSILEGQPQHLTHFCITAFDGYRDSVALPPSFLCTLTSLQELHLDILFDEYTGYFAAHLPMLTLPALSSIRLLVDFSIPANFLPDLLALIKRSGCNLRELSFGERVRLPVTSTHPDSSALFEIFALSPGLTKLALTHLDTEGIRRLMLDPSSSRPMLPNLTHLTIEFITFENPEPEGRGQIDVAALTEMFLSHKRIGPDGRMEQVLKRVHLIDYDHRFMQSNLVAGWEARQFELGHVFQNSPDPRTMTEEVAEVFNLIPWIYAHGMKPSQMSKKDKRKVRTLIEVLEGVDFERVNASLIERLDVVSALKGIARDQAYLHQKRPDPNPAFHGLHIRADALVEKLKPFVLRDAKSCPYRWRYKYSYQVALEWDPVEDEESFWKALLGPSEE